VVGNGGQGSGTLDESLPFYNQTYYWRVTVWDNTGIASNPSARSSFTTPRHRYPEPLFNLAPSAPAKNEVTQFCSTDGAPCTTNVAKCYNDSNNLISCSGKNISWVFEEQNSVTRVWESASVTYLNDTNANSENPTLKFVNVGSKRITLRIADEVGACSKQQNIKVIPVPKWREVAP
jgi:hypothetical protein